VSTSLTRLRTVLGARTSRRVISALSSPAAGAVAWMALRERTISRWIGVVSVLPVLAVLGMTVGTGLPGFPGVVMPLWLVVTGLGLALGRSPVTR